jgi:antitoxin component HigA of HigAB toxin-antitoxin module
MTASVEKNHVVDVEKIKSLCEIRGIPLAEFGRRIGLDSREGISRRLQNKHKITGDELVEQLEARWAHNPKVAAVGCGPFNKVSLLDGQV